MSHAATNWAIQQRGLKPAAKLVLWHLCDRYNPDFGCFPSQETLAADCELSRSSLNDQLVTLEAAGLIARERRRQKGTQKMEQTRYRLAFEPGFAPVSPPEPSPEFGHGQDGEAESENRAEPCPKNGESHVRNSDSNPVREPLIEPVNEREGASASTRPATTGQSDEIALRAEGRRATPPEGGEGESHDDRKSLTRRVKALEMGKHGNPWPGVLGSSTDWTIRQFAALDEADRREAEAKRDAYLAVCKAQAVKPVALGNYLRDRKFLDVSTETARAAVRKIDRAPARPFGPVWGGMRALCLGQGPGPVDMPGDVRGEAENVHAALRKASEARAAAWRERKGVTLGPDGRLVFPDDFETAEYRRRQTEDGYPLVKHLDTLARDARAELVDGKNAALAELCEPVPVGSALMDAWREFHERRGWRVWPDPGRMAVVYLPKGGPDGFEAFMRAARAAVSDGGRGDADAA